MNRHDPQHVEHFNGVTEPSLADRYVLTVHVCMRACVHVCIHVHADDMSALYAYVRHTHTHTYSGCGNTGGPLASRQNSGPRTHAHTQSHLC